MASGFIILQDGRCFARRWWCYDAVLREIAGEPIRDRQELELGAWLESLLPGTEDEQELGYGAWLRKSDGKIVPRHLDVMELTAANQRLFNSAARRASARLQTTGADELLPGVSACLSPLVAMIERAERGEHPLSLSDWVSVGPPSGKRAGPGWGRSPSS